MRIVPTSPHIGAEILDVDLRTLDDGDFATIHRAFVDHGVVFFRDQDLGPADHVAFAERWGAINVNRFFSPVEGHPMIAEVRKEPDQAINIGGGWHTDHSYDQIPALGSILYAREVPPIGGDTMFASQYAAYDALSPAMQDTLLELWADHSSRHVFGAGGAGRQNNPEAATQDALHPVVIEHPLSGRPALYVNLAFTLRFHGWTDGESAPLLQWLYGHCARPEFTTRFSWRPGSLAVWDNRAVQHNALNDYHGHRRLMHRITIEGTEVGPARPKARPATEGR
ncbi:MAG: TauD/TfdA family dioxygenase [Actinomycetota bacterium]